MIQTRLTAGHPLALAERAFTCSRIIYYAALVRTRNVTSFADHPLIHAIDRPKTHSMNLDSSFLASPEVFFGRRLHDLGAAGVNAPWSLAYQACLLSLF